MVWFLDAMRHTSLQLGASFLQESCSFSCSVVVILDGSFG